jgi:8-amino-7-oxononanoate synthase
MNLHQRLEHFLAKRRDENTFRQLQSSNLSIDFSSNDYLGLAKSTWIKQQIASNLNTKNKYHQIGATGSRLLNGNSNLFESLEMYLANFHHAEAALIFNSGYNANVGLVSTVARKNDVIFYDEHVHASIHQAMKISQATLIFFQHNDIEDLENKLKTTHDSVIKFIITESLFSMDGEKAPLQAIASISKKYNCNLIVDEAHANGIFGEKGSGLCNDFGIEKDCFARVYTFGKALGTHGAVVLGSKTLKDYLINFSKPFIYSTALNLYDLLSIQYAYLYIEKFNDGNKKLSQNIEYFKKHISAEMNIKGEGPIFSYLIPDTFKCKAKAIALQQQGIDVRAIVYPTVQRQTERIRIILHSYNTFDEIDRLLNLILE